MPKNLWHWPGQLGEPPAFGSGGAAPPAAARLVGYKVVANDGEIGHVDTASTEVDAAHVVVDVGGWLVGRRTLIPAGAVRDVNHDSRTIQVDLTRDEIKEAPDYLPDDGLDAYRSAADLYFGGLGRFPLYP